MAPTTSSGYTTPDSELESVLLPHPTAARRPHQIVVESENAQFSDEYITSKYTDRGADVVVVNGQYIVKPTARSYEFQTQRKVSKTGCAFLHADICYRIHTDIFRFVVQVDDDWNWRK
jgi:myo-inositol-1-phosphate synthase